MGHVMDRAEAVELLRRLHKVQQAFYAGGDEAPVRARREIGCFGRTKPCICARTELRNSGART